MKHTTLRVLADQFDAFFIDQFGVLMDATGAYPFAIDSVKRLSELGKPMILLSNSGKRALKNEERLTRLGFEVCLFTKVITSGEVAYSVIKKNIQKKFPKKPKVFIISRDSDTSPIDDLNCDVCDRIEKADFIIISGSEPEKYSLQFYHNLLKPAVDRNVPAFCINPDMIMLTKTGTSFGAGAIAKEYEKLGGNLSWFGKPYGEIYNFARKFIPEILPQKVLCIGDSPEHDIRGGYFANCKTALVRSGIHSKSSFEELVEGLADSDRADFVIPNFSFV